jgi:hypothetical protein
VGEAVSTERRWNRARVGIALAVLLGVMIWRLQSPNVAVERAVSALAPEHSELHAPERRELAADGVPIMPAGAHPAALDQPMHPHPITPAHQRIYRENNLVGALNVAVDLEDARRIREVLAQYRAEYPEDAHRLQQGYAIIADCLDQLDDATRERAQRFWRTEIRSQTRRYVRRHCLERDRAS